MHQYTPSPLRSLALLSGLTLIGTFVSVLYAIVDVVGGVGWLLAAVAGAVLAATVSARWLPVRVAGAVGLAVFALGSAAYVWAAPAPYYRVFTVEFVAGQFVYLAGTSVLQFVNVDVWAITVAPAPVFLTWYLFVRRQYDHGVLVGGASLGYFVLTGDAGWSTTVLGTVSALGVLGLGALEKSGGTWEQVERLGIVLAVATLAAQAVRGVWTDDGAWKVDPVGGSDSAGSGGGGSEEQPPTVEASLTESDRRVRLFEDVTLSTEVRFTIASTAPTYWHVASYDRYTGEEWFLTGPDSAYAGPLEAPPGETVSVEQTFRAEGPIETMPAAWKPVRVLGEAAETARVSSAGALGAARTLAAGEEYTVVSQVPDVTADQLRSADASSPARVRERYLQLPDSTPSRLGRKAREIAADAATSYDAVRAIQRWLETTKAYSLSVERPRGDVADAFVFGMDSGYCVYFATAMTVLLRTLEIPARLTHGYLPGERGEDGTWVVRGLDAHAWTEVYFPGAGWIPFDPTPSEPRRAAERTRLDGEQPTNVERIASVEARQVGGTPTPESTVEVGSVSPEPENDTARSPTPAPNATNGSQPGGSGSTESPNPVARLSTTVSRTDRLTVAAAVVGTVIGVRQLRLLERGYRAVWLRRQPRTDSPRVDTERAFERLEYLLARRHRAREPRETARQYLDALAPEVDARADRVGKLYERAHYGGPIDRDEADEAIRLVDELVADRD